MQKGSLSCEVLLMRRQVLLRLVLLFALAALNIGLLVLCNVQPELTITFWYRQIIPWGVSMKPPLGMLVHTHKVMPILSSVLVLIGFSNLM